MEHEQSGRKRSVVDLAYPLRIVTGALFGVIVVLTIAQVFFRFVIGSPLVWSEEVARTCVVWVTFIGAAVVCWDGTHLNVDVLFRLMPSRIRAWVRAFNATVAVIFLGAMAYFGWPLVVLSNRQLVGSLNTPLSVIRISGVVGAVLMIAFIVLRGIYRRPAEQAAGDNDDNESNDAM